MPVKLVRVITILSLFFGLFFFVIVAYIVLSMILDPMPAGESEAEHELTRQQLLDSVDAELSAGEAQLRAMERYVTSDTFTIRSRFRDL